MSYSSPAARHPRVLVVDDDTLLRDLLEAILVDANYDVVTAGDGQAALEAVTRHKPDTCCSTSRCRV